MSVQNKKQITKTDRRKKNKATRKARKKNR